MNNCPARPDQVCFSGDGFPTAARLELLAYEYQSSENLKAYISLFLKQLELINKTTCLLEFDIDTSTGHQLTLIGEFVGLPRTICNVTQKGCCAGISQGTSYTFVDDELYRTHIKAWLMARNSVGLVVECQEIARLLYGDDARVTAYKNNRAEVETGRLLMDDEKTLKSFVETNILPRPFLGKMTVNETTDTSKIEC